MAHTAVESQASANTNTDKHTKKVSITAGDDTKAHHTQTNAKKKKCNDSMRPGRLFGRIPFKIHTADAGLLFSGHSAKNAISLLQFGGQMTAIWDAAERDDPYADWMLLKIYDALIQCRSELQSVIEAHQNTIHHTYRNDTVNVAPFTSQKPIVKSLWFRTPYGYLGASVVADFDELMRVVLTANRVGVLLDQSHDTIKTVWISKIVTLFKLPFKWQRLNITRDAIESNHELVSKAENLMGQCPMNVLDKTLRSPFSPTIKNNLTIQQEELNTHEETSDF